MRDLLLSIGLGAVLCIGVGVDYSAEPPLPAPECPEHTFMCCRTFTEEPDCKGGALECRPGFEACEQEDAGAD